MKVDQTRCLKDLERENTRLRKAQTDWQARQARDLLGEDIVRLILDGTGVKARALPTSPPAQQRQQDVINRVLAA